MDLKELLGEELYNQVMAKAGSNKLAIVSDGNWFPKEKFDEVNTAKKNAEKLVADRDKQIADLSKTAGASEELKKQIETLQNDNKTAKEEYEKGLKDLQTSTALKMALSGKVHDADMVISMLDKSKIEIDESGLIKAGLDDQVQALQTSKAFLFVDAKQQYKFNGIKPQESSQQQQQQSGGSIGERLAKQSQAPQSTQQAQTNYFN